MVFDGRFIHAAPAALKPLKMVGKVGRGEQENTEKKEERGEHVEKKEKKETAENEKTEKTEGEGEGEAVRVTLLVNVWLNHSPIGLDALPANVPGLCPGTSYKPI
jgi:hypothetical protein